MDLSTFGKWIVVIGLIVAGVGLVVWLAGKSGLPFGSLPGDISVERPGFLVPLSSDDLHRSEYRNYDCAEFLAWFFRR